MTSHHALPTFRLAPGTGIAQSQPAAVARVTLDSPALAVMTDLTQVKAATVAPGATLRHAEQTMVYQGVRMLFVVGETPSVIGLITTTDLQGERPMRRVHERSSHYDELIVADVMTELASIDAIDHDLMRGATVGEVISTLQRFGRNHLLVVQKATAATPHRIRGVLSRAQIERQLGEPVDVTPIATSFSEIERALV